MNPPRPLDEAIADPRAWLLAPGVDFLNHGSFGARLQAVVEAQRGYQDRFESRPVEFLDREAPGLLRDARRRIGGFLGIDEADFGFTSNATDSVTAVVRSIELAPGDEILTTDHVYNGVRQTIRHVAGRFGLNDTVYLANPGLRASSDVFAGNAQLDLGLAGGVTTVSR